MVQTSGTYLTVATLIALLAIYSKPNPQITLNDRAINRVRFITYLRIRSRGKEYINRGSEILDYVSTSIEPSNKE